MLKKHLQFSLLFLVIFIAQIFLQVDDELAKLFLGDVHYFVKPLITISLMIYLGYQTKLRGRFSKLIFAGLFFGLIGDCLLMFEGATFFMYGLVAFLIGHLLYSSAFYIDYTFRSNIEPTIKFTSITVFGIFIIGFCWLLLPHLGSLKIPVTVYALVIAMMGILAINRKSRVKAISFQLIAIGAILFVCSDSILAYNKFVKHFEMAGALILGTYMLAQYLITIGTLERKLRKNAE